MSSTASDRRIGAATLRTRRAHGRGLPGDRQPCPRLDKSTRTLLNSKMNFSIEGLRSVVQRSGFIHQLSSFKTNEMMFRSRQEIVSRNRFELISHGEIELLLCLMSEAPLDEAPPSPKELEDRYTDCKSELEALSNSLRSLSFRMERDDAFSNGAGFIEPIFYSSSSAFWFDCLILAPQLYEFDKDFLVARGYPIQETADLLRRMQDVFEVRFRDASRAARRNSKRGRAFVGPLEAFVFSSRDLDKTLSNTFEWLVEKFQIRPGSAPTLTNPLGYHPAKARPALRLGDDRIFAPLIPMLGHQLFENPFYEIASDTKYFSNNANDRGKSAERIVTRLLNEVKKTSAYWMTSNCTAGAMRLIKSTQRRYLGLWRSCLKPRVNASPKPQN